jgi:hypothetical protein
MNGSASMRAALLLLPLLTAVGTGVQAAPTVPVKGVTYVSRQVSTMSLC